MKRLLSLRCAVLAVILLLFVPATLLRIASAVAEGLNEQYTVDGVEILGNRRVDTSAIEAQLKATKGTVGSDAIDEDIKTLYKTGFFDQVSVSIVEKNGRNLLKYNLVEKPVVRKVYITGNQNVDEGDLKDIIKFDTRRFLDKAKVEAIIRNASSYYQTQGYFDAAISYSVVPVGDNQVDVTFTVEEGESFKIREVRVKGLEKLDEDDVLSVMQTRRYKWYNSWLLSTGRLNMEMLQNDKTLIRQYLLDHGFVDGTVSEPSVEKRDDGIYISVDVKEGTEYKIGSLTASGDLLEGGTEEVLDRIKSAEGETFSASQVREDTFKISDKYTDIGYAFANVIPETTINREAGTVDIDFRANRGKLVTINRIKIRGNEKTYDNVIRRELKIAEQETYSGTKIRRSQELLQRLGYFEEVNISSEPADDDKVDLTVNVREGSTGTFSAGAGYSSSDGAIFNARVSENNLFGTGRSVSLNFDIGTERENLVLSYDDRRFNDSRLAVGADLLRTEREFSDFDRSMQGGSLSAGYPLSAMLGESWDDVAFSLRYELLSIDISDVDALDAAPLVLASEGESTSSGITPSLTRNTINNPLNPSKGSRQQISFEKSGLGGDEDYYLFEVSNQWYLPLIQSSYGDLTFSWRTRFDYGESNNGEPFPLFKRFFPGGINSVRGFKNRTLGPKDDRGNEFGGSKQLVNNFELIFPLVNSAGLKAVVFYDMGEAFDDDDSIHVSDLRRAYGAGIRWTSPLGPIRIEFGFPVDREDDEDSMVTLFSFGAPL